MIRRVVQRLEGALAAEMVRVVLTRMLEVDGDRLTIRLPATHADGVAVTRTLTWTRVG